MPKENSYAMAAARIPVDQERDNVIRQNAEAELQARFPGINLEENLGYVNLIVTLAGFNDIPHDGERLLVEDGPSYMRRIAGERVPQEMLGEAERLADDLYGGWIQEKVRRQARG